MYCGRGVDRCCGSAHQQKLYRARCTSRQDLETRKRAPLYQKKQEEELRAAGEKAAEAELRAQDADLRCKEAKVCKHFCTGRLCRDHT